MSDPTEQLTEAPPPAGQADSEAPAAEPQQAVEPGPPVQPEPVAQSQPGPPPEPAAKPPAPSGHCRAPLKELPAYTRSLLRIRVPVVVTLAEKRQPLRQIFELGAGSIIQFNKSCEEMLDLSVGGHRVANGEAVKVGDKFGLRITSIVLPDERFRPVRP